MDTLVTHPLFGYRVNYRRTNPDGLQFPLATSGGEMGMPSCRVPREFHAKGAEVWRARTGDGM